MHKDNMITSKWNKKLEQANSNEKIGKVMQK